MLQVKEQPSSSSIRIRSIVAVRGSDILPFKAAAGWLLP